MRNFLKKLVENSQMAINDGIYEINENLEKSKIDLIKEIKAYSKTPIIVSVNCVTAKEWPQLAKHFEEAGADGIELNISIFPDLQEKK